MKLSLDQKIVVSLLVFLILCLLVFWVLLEKPVQTPDGAEESPEPATSVSAGSAQLGLFWLHRNVRSSAGADSKVAHDVEALEESGFLLTVARPETPARPESSSREG